MSYLKQKLNLYFQARAYILVQDFQCLLFHIEYRQILKKSVWWLLDAGD